MTNTDAMPPFEIRDKLISDLKATRLAFFRAETAIELDTMTKPQKEKAGKLLIDANIAITKLENIELKSIADELKSASSALVTASENLRDAINDMEKFKIIVDRAVVVLNLIEKAADLAGVSIG